MKNLYYLKHDSTQKFGVRVEIFSQKWLNDKKEKDGIFKKKHLSDFHNIFLNSKTLLGDSTNRKSISLIFFMGRVEIK
ncbi:MAG: hypothetical protein DRO88_06370 [Promethearchaeia archaeon]|nr:MAG: hypothetical protein DRO88_06370 [Candidatus Lokiarchaeia archaeon]